MVNIEADFFEVEAEQVHLDLFAADLTRQLGILDAIVDRLEILGESFNAEHAENAE